MHLHVDWEKPPKATIAQLYKNSLILTANNEKLIAISATQTPQVTRKTQEFKQHYRLKNIEHKSIQQDYDNLLMVDCLGIYHGLGKYPTELLRQSPKIHLEELIDSLTPQIIIADGSNFPSFVERWQKTCAAKGIKFHATAIQGAYPLN